MKKIIALLTVVGLFIGCTNDQNTYINSDEILETRFETPYECYEHINWQVASQEAAFQALIEEFDIQSTTSTLSSTPLFVDSNYIVRCENIEGNYVSYTLPIYKDSTSNDEIMNVMLELKGEQLSGKIISYGLSYENITSLYNRELYDTIFMPVNVRDINSGELQLRGCVTITLQITIPCTCAGHLDPSKCICPSRGGVGPSISYRTFLACDGEIGGENIPLYPTDEGTGVLGGGGATSWPVTGGPNPGGDGSGTEILMPTDIWYDIKTDNFLSTYPGINLTPDQFQEIVPIDCMGGGNPQIGEFENCAKSSLITHLGINISPQQEKWVKDNFTVYGSLLNFKNGNSHLLQQSKIDALEAYIGLLESDEDFREYALVEHPALPSWMWGFIKDIGIEVAKELAKRYGPASIVDDVVDAVGDLAQGEILNFMGEVIDIVRRKVGALAAVSLTLDGIELGGKASKVWKAIARMEQFGEQVINKFMDVIRATGGNVMDKLKYVDNATGIKLSNVGSAEGFFDNFQNAIEDAFSDVVILSPSQLAPYELAGFKFNNNVIRVSIKYGGTTNPNGYTLEMKWGNQSQPLKFRFL